MSRSEERIKVFRNMIARLSEKIDGMNFEEIGKGLQHPNTMEQFRDIVNLLEYTIERNDIKKEKTTHGTM